MTFQMQQRGTIGRKTSLQLASYFVGPSIETSNAIYPLPTVIASFSPCLALLVASRHCLASRIVSTSTPMTKLALAPTLYLSPCLALQSGAC